MEGAQSCRGCVMLRTSCRGVPEYHMRSELSSCCPQPPFADAFSHITPGGPPFPRLGACSVPAGAVLHQLVLRYAPQGAAAQREAHVHSQGSPPGGKGQYLAGVLEQCLYLNVASLLRQPVLRLGYCGTPFIGAVSGFLRQERDHDRGRDERFAVVLCGCFDCWPALSEPLLEYGSETEAAIGLLRHQEFKQPVCCGGALPLLNSLVWLRPPLGEFVPHP